MGWDTAFDTLGVQASLPGQLGLVAQWLDGDTYWLQGTRPDGTLSPFASLVCDAFSAKFLLLTRVVHGSHRLSLRRDEFEMHREQGQPSILSDHGDAWTLAYRYEHSAHWGGGIEWLRIDSSREPWAIFYAAPKDATETEVRVQVTYRLGVAER